MSPYRHLAVKGMGYMSRAFWVATGGVMAVLFAVLVGIDVFVGYAIWRLMQ